MMEVIVLDTTQVAIEIRHLITAGSTEQQLLAAVARRFPELTSAELSQALQVAQAQAEAKALASKPNPARGRALLAHWRAIKPKQPARRH
jgi:hypothetical protein